MENKIERLYLSPPHMGGLEMGFIQEAFESNWIAPLGPNINAFETEINTKFNIPFSVALSSGTAALHLALVALGIKQGDEVWCSTLTFSASANPIVYQNGTPVFIDSDEISWNCDPNLLSQSLDDAAKSNRLPKAVIIVDLYGQSADWDPIIMSCEKHGVKLIEDSAEALGVKYKGKYAGTFGWCGIYSFNGNKIITTSGGGMLVSNDKKLIEKVRYLSTQARDAVPYYQHSQIGYNYRLSNVLAGIGRGQLSVLDDRIKKRREIFLNYQKLLLNIPGISFMPEETFNDLNSMSNRWLTVIQIDANLFGSSSENIRKELEIHNIESRPVWKPMHLQPIFNNCRVLGGEISEKLFHNGLCLPSGSKMIDNDIVRVCEIIKSQYKKNR